MAQILLAAILILVALATTALQDAGLIPVLAQSSWDYTATIFWSLVPFFLCMFIGVLTHVIWNIWPIVKMELETRSAMNDALMWQARHAAKAQRTGKN